MQAQPFIEDQVSPNTGLPSHETKLASHSASPALDLELYPDVEWRPGPEPWPHDSGAADNTISLLDDPALYGSPFDLEATALTILQSPLLPDGFVESSSNSLSAFDELMQTPGQQLQDYSLVGMPALSENSPSDQEGQAFRCPDCAKDFTQRHKYK